MCLPFLIAIAEERLLQNANSLLKSVGLQDKPLTEAAELQQSASSMYVHVQYFAFFFTGSTSLRQESYIFQRLFLWLTGFDA